MDEWLKQLQHSIDEAAEASSRVLTQVAQRSEQLIEQWLDDSIDMVEMAEKSIEDSLAPALIQINERVETALDAGEDFVHGQLTPWLEQVTAPIANTVNPLLQDHPTCVGCRNYHGADYGNEMLVCGMHPYGPEGEQCPDWESVWPKMPDVE